MRGVLVLVLVLAVVAARELPATTSSKAAVTLIIMMRFIAVLLGNAARTGSGSSLGAASVPRSSRRRNARVPNGLAGKAGPMRIVRSAARAPLRASHRSGLAPPGHDLVRGVSGSSAAPGSHRQLDHAFEVERGAASERGDL